MTRVLLDTDIGSDIDDAVALAWLLANPDCDLVGITTVTGQSVLRAGLADAICRAAGADVPIVPGNERPLEGEQRQPSAPQAAALDRWPHRERFPEIAAEDFMAETIRLHAGGITLLAIGPLTNVARLFLAHPDIPALLDRLVLMCGVFRDGEGLPAVEWNAGCDPRATAVVYDAGVKRHESVGLDLTLRVSMEAEEVRRRFRGPVLEPVLDFAGIWFRNENRITFHDPLAAVTIFADDVCRFEEGRVRVELARGDRAGATLRRPGKGPHRIAVDVDPERFFERFFEPFGSI